MNLELSGKSVIVSGGRRGIGLAIARKFLDEGAKVAIFARGEDGVSEALAELSPLGEIHGTAVDSADQAQQDQAAGGQRGRRLPGDERAVVALSAVGVGGVDSRVGVHQRWRRVGAQVGEVRGALGGTPTEEERGQADDE